MTTTIDATVDTGRAVGALNAAFDEAKIGGDLNRGNTLALIGIGFALAGIADRLRSLSDLSDIHEVAEGIKTLAVETGSVASAVTAVR